MPFDGIVAKCMADELSLKLAGGRIEKIFQPEPDEIIMNVRTRGESLKLLISANPSFARIHLTGVQKENPFSAPAFCMLLRKHLSGGKITGVEFSDYERIIALAIESVDELGDPVGKKLIAEIMGRHSNIILTGNGDRIHDSIKHVNSEVSSVREILPGKTYVLPPAQDKINPEFLDAGDFVDEARTIGSGGSGMSVEGYMLASIKGFSPALCREVCFRARLDGKATIARISDDEADRLKKVLQEITDAIKRRAFEPCIAFDGSKPPKPLDFHCIRLCQFENTSRRDSISSVMDMFYSEKDRAQRLSQKKSDLVKAVSNNMDRCRKKLAIQQETLRDVAGRENLRLYGELLTANIYRIPKNAGSVRLENFYCENNEEIEIPLDKNLLPQENAQKYFKQYQKAKSTFQYTSGQVEESLKELQYFEGVHHLLESCATMQEVEEIRQELADQGYVSAGRRRKSRGREKPSSPLQYRSSDGFDILVGKNNRQNDLLTLKMSSSDDIWLHTKNIPGSHVIIKAHHGQIPDSTLLEAASIAAYHSKAGRSSSVPVDYTAVKNVKKPPAAKPGMVIYDNFKTITVTPDEEEILKLRTGDR